MLRFKKLIFTLLFSMLSLTFLVADETPWTGKWHVFWKSGTFVATLEQHGWDVNGSFSPSDGIIHGTIDNHTLMATTVNKGKKLKHITLTMSETQNAFFGKVNLTDEWMTGIRVDTDTEFNAHLVDLSSPVNMLYTFLTLGNSVRAGNYEVLEKAMNIVQFTETQEKFRHGNKLALTNMIFLVIDACTISKLDFVESENHENASVTFKQTGSDVKTTIHFIEDQVTKQWKIKLPETSVLEDQFKALLSTDRVEEIDPKSNLELLNPRASMRTFVEQYDRWETGGKKFVISTMNLSEIDPAIHEWQAPLLAYYIKSVLDRISYVMYQEIPNGQISKKPYVHFHHPIADIIISPYEVEGKIIWQFSPKTLENIDELYYEMQHVQPKAVTKKISENNLYFSLQKFAHEVSPLLLTDIYYAELWQILMLIVILVLAILTSYLITYVVFYLFHKFYITKRWSEEKITLNYLRPMQMTTFGIILLYGAHQLGLSNVIFSLIKSFTQLLIVIGMTWIIYNLISLMFSILQIRASKTTTNVDEIILSLTSSVLRILVITVSLFLIAEIFNIPYQTVIAGLGIGGLAFAIGAKDTIANFFGSAIIIADRPFKTGDKIKIGPDIGVITHVGIRSTKIRTTYDTMLSIPNNKITQETIDNYTEREAMRVDASFFFSLDTSKASLDTVDTQIATYLREDKDVNSSKVILTGVSEYTKRGIEFGIRFFVNAETEGAYSDLQHRIVTEIAEIIKECGIEMVMFPQEYTKEV